MRVLAIKTEPLEERIVMFLLRGRGKIILPFFFTALAIYLLLLE